MLGEGVQVLGACFVPLVDALVAVGDDDQGKAGLVELSEDGEVKFGAVLGLIDDDLEEAVAQQARNGRVPDVVEGGDADLVPGHVAAGLPEVVASSLGQPEVIRLGELRVDEVSGRGGPLHPCLAGGRIVGKAEGRQGYSARSDKGGRDVVPGQDVLPGRGRRQEGADQVAPQEAVEGAEEVRVGRQVRTVVCAAVA